MGGSGNTIRQNESGFKVCAVRICGTRRNGGILRSTWCQLSRNLIQPDRFLQITQVSPQTQSHHTTRSHHGTQDSLVDLKRFVCVHGYLYCTYKGGGVRLYACVCKAVFVVGTVDLGEAWIPESVTFRGFLAKTPILYCWCLPAHLSLFLFPPIQIFISCEFTKEYQQ